MGIKIYCDICGREMGMAKTHPKRIRKFGKEHGDVCKRCLNIEDQIVEFIQNKKSSISKKIDALTEDAKKKTHKEIRKTINRKTLWEKLFGGKPKEAEDE